MIALCSAVSPSQCVEQRRQQRWTEDMQQREKTDDEGDRTQTPRIARN